MNHTQVRHASSCGARDTKLGGKKIYNCEHCKMMMDRDVNGAKNIFLKNFEALTLELAMGPPLQSGGRLLHGDRNVSARSPQLRNF